MDLEKELAQMDMSRRLSIETIAVYNVPFAMLYSLTMFAIAGIAGVISFTGEPIIKYIERGPEQLLIILVLIVCVSAEIARFLIMSYNIIMNNGRALFVRDNRIIFISRYFCSIPIDKIVKIVAGKKKVVRIILSNGKLKKIYTSFLKPNDSTIIAQKIEALVRGAAGE